MTENRRYYYLKLKEYFFNSETMMILESMQDGLLYSNLLLKMYLMSLKSGGILLLGDHFPHTPQTIATCTRHAVVSSCWAITSPTRRRPSPLAPAIRSAPWSAV